MSQKNSHSSRVEDGTKIGFMQLSYAPNNCIPFMEYFSKKLKSEFSTFGQCVLLGTEPDHRAIYNCPAMTDIEIDALSPFQTQMKIQAEKDVLKSVASWNQIKIKITGEILIHLSRASENRMMQEADFETLCNDNDAVKLFELIKKVHTIEQDGDVAKRTKIIQTFNSMKQGNQDFYGYYCRRFNTICDLMKGVKRDKSDEEKVEQFMISLNPDIYKNEVARRLFAKPLEIPKDLPAAQRYFGSWSTSLKSSISQMETKNSKNNNVDSINEQINFIKHNNKNANNNSNDNYNKNKKNKQKKMKIIQSLI